jgi:hypothetical protein
MYSWFSSLFSGSMGHPASHRRFYRPEPEALERRDVASATSWFDHYHYAHVSACGQERRGDGEAFAIDWRHDLVENRLGVLPVDVSKEPGAVDHGYADDISAGRDALGNPQCLVHGRGNNLSLWNSATGWHDLHFDRAELFATVSQISAGEDGSLFVLDRAHTAWEYYGGGWIRLRNNVLEIQATRSMSDTRGLYIRDCNLQVWHLGHTYYSFGWQELGTGRAYHAHALSVNALDNVFIINDAKQVCELRRETLDWAKAFTALPGGFHAEAIDACTIRDQGALYDQVYALLDDVVPPPNDNNCHSFGIDDCGGTGTSAEWCAFNSRPWLSGSWWLTGIYSDSYDFSGASGTTTVYVAAYDPYSLSPTDWSILSIDWLAHYGRWVCATLPSVP